MRSFDRRDAAPSRLFLAAIAGTSTLAIAFLLVVGAGSFARADEPRESQVELPSRTSELAARLAAKGFAVTEPIIRRGQTYLTHGTDKHGQRVRLVLDARSSEIIGLRVVEPQRTARERTAARP
ncbi:hypothetical protein E8L99_00760 [Phreatobacter aquaticus]|uniref:PepSY domain-containing protein n=1 Tax=Phreatobacter aquaticus TaxID=2570229 RepID=A0A4D7QGC4_9HYPH|nr:PepSY domain-containing protein [Phreatobacter aquaticus]QCK84427.1 hypothetical protein E8L99_00760 [Phreatobacter aquaticus]